MLSLKKIKSWTVEEMNQHACRTVQFQGMVNMRTNNMTEMSQHHENIGVNTIEKSPEMSQSMENDVLSHAHKVLNQPPFPETSSIQSFQGEDNASISSVLDRKARLKRKRTPYYRIIDKNSKSVKQYWRERNRRKQVWKLHGEWLTYPQIAKKLGISVKTVQRDMKKIAPYYRGILFKQLRELDKTKSPP